nr:MAG TPA: hypothetical protein [Caudoviricetes sp.]
MQKGGCSSPKPSRMPQESKRRKKEVSYDAIE